MDPSERGVLELKMHLLENDVHLTPIVLNQMVMHGVLTDEKASELRVRRITKFIPFKVY